MSTPSTPSSDAPAPRHPVVAERIYRLLLCAYPPAFRNAFGREMTQVFRDQCRMRGSTTALTLWMNVVLDVARSAPAIRIEAWCARCSERIRTLGGTMKGIALLTVLIGVLGALNALAEGMAAGRGALDGTHLLAVTLGGTAGALLFASGAALLRGATRSKRTASLAALASLLFVLIARVTHPWMSLFSQVAGVVLPIALLAVLHLSHRSDSRPA